MIPRANVKNLMLKREVVKAVEENQFHIYPVETIEEGIEILTRIPAGTPDDKGNFPSDCLYGKVQKKLMYFLKQSLKLRVWSAGERR